MPPSPCSYAPLLLSDADRAFVAAALRDSCALDECILADVLGAHPRFKWRALFGISS